MNKRWFKYAVYCFIFLVAVYFLLSRTTRYHIDHSEVIVSPVLTKSQAEYYAFGYQPDLKYSETRRPCRVRYPLKKAFFGDLHVHTAISADAYPDGTRTFPDDAYRYAKGAPIALPVPEGIPPLSVQLERPLDFVAVTDHSEAMGEGYICRNEGKFPGYSSKACETFRQGGQPGVRVFMTETARMRPKRNRSVCGKNNEDCEKASRIVWREMIESAEAAYDKTETCSFSTFVGYEYTRSTNNNHLHRNTIFKNASVPDLPATFIDYPSLQSLLGKLETSCRKDIEACDVISIPHNSNLSGGNAFNPEALRGYSKEAQQAHRKQRNAFDRLAEITQHKGTSECQNGFADILSDEDEYCNYEAIRKIGKPDKAIDLSTYIPRMYDVITKECEANDMDPKDNFYKGYCISSNDFLRGALLEGLSEEDHHHVNPFEFGIIGSSDTHLGTPGQTDEASWSGHIADETTLEGRLGEAELGRNNKLMANPGGLAGVWAVENSRDALFQSMKRREAFGTSGTRITPRFFVGHYPADLCKRKNWLYLAYQNGTPMGSKLSSQTENFQLLAQATRDPHPSAKGLEKLQIVKGWLDHSGHKHIKVTDIAKMEPANLTGDDMLCAVYADPEYDPSLNTYYYLRVAETESNRWSSAQCEALPVVDRPEGCINNSLKKIRELAWTSPIWLIAAEP
ncbi:DUF3604 domain-containing protein [Microbulbifer sp. 2205BS26-8]|uniref:DUF3604 domain-containing protein n=1 Tax=Microbulbifer sp. 2205BS26-8 TaxID=3064386 RepID=UPI00273E5647|nr:DUF3604 domain-containing protein [Microbulbifer sp. 2205BS26-8]MDP5209551.1 DUF3604 domain-containing protein [Microbulbifer sp. 2205BS26-8]